MTDDTLAQLADLYGIQTAYADGLGGGRAASTEAVMAILRGLGAEIERPEDALSALDARRAQLAQRLTEPVAVAWDGADLEVVLDVDTRARKWKWSLILEGGERHWNDGLLADLEPLGTAVAGRQRRRLSIGGVPFGYHDLYIKVGRREAAVAVIAAPRRAHA